MNAVTGQNLAVVSEVKGTTTDPVTKIHGAAAHGAGGDHGHPGIDDSGRVGGTADKRKATKR